MVKNLIEKPELKNNGFTGQENKYRASSYRFSWCSPDQPYRGIPGRNSPWKPKKNQLRKDHLTSTIFITSESEKKARKSAKLRKLGE